MLYLFGAPNELNLYRQDSKTVGQVSFNRDNRSGQTKPAEQRKANSSKEATGFGLCHSIILRNRWSPKDRCCCPVDSRRVRQGYHSGVGGGLGCACRGMSRNWELEDEVGKSRYRVVKYTLTYCPSAQRFKTSLQFLALRYGDVYSTLDACRVADYVVFVLSPTVEVDKRGDTLLRTLQAQGLPDVVTILHPDASSDPKTKAGVLKSLLSFIQYFVPSQTRVYDIHSSSDRLNALRSLCEGKPSEVRWRENRSYILGEEVVWSEGILRVTGYVRGSQLSPDRLVHIPGHGDYQIQCVSVIIYCLYNISTSFLRSCLHPLVIPVLRIQVTMRLRLSRSSLQNQIRNPQIH